MTIRSGGRPRDPRQNGQVYAPDAYATEAAPEHFEPVRRGGRGDRHGGGGGSGLAGLLKFVLFAGVLAGVVLIASLTVLRPLINSVVVGWAADNPGALKMPFVAEIVRSDLGPALTQGVSGDATPVPFVVAEGDSASTIGARLQEEGLLRDGRAFVFIATERGLSSDFLAGDFILRRNMTPNQVVSALLAPPEDPYVQIDLRTGLRLEQITAKLQTLPLDMNVRDFYDLAKEPPAALIADYPWLAKALLEAPQTPVKPSLEGFLWPASYRVLPDVKPEELIRMMLDNFIENVGEGRLDVPAERGLNFYQVLILASLVEREAVLDVDRPLIAGVFQNRLDPKLFGNLHLGSDPTIFWINDTLQLAKMEVSEWVGYTFWTTLNEQLPAALPPELTGYNTYIHQGLPVGPICTPTVKSIDAALNPDTKDKYLYFFGKEDDSGETVYAKTAKQHQANIAKYGKP